MAKRGRPRSPRAASAQIIHTKLRLYPGEDNDLIAFFAEIPLGDRAARIKQALRSGINTEASPGVDLDDDLLEALEAFIA
jgi:hypothetical protein